MPILLLAAFIGVPLLEIAVFIQVGGLIGLWPTLALVILTAAIGSWQLRAQGLATLSRARGQMDAGRLPARELFDGLCLLFAGALLLTPGFVTDAFGLLLFLPAFREWLRGWASRYVQTHGETRVWVNGEEVRRPDGPGGRGGGAGGGAGRGTVIDGEFEELRPERDPDPRDPDDSEPPAPRQLGGKRP